MSAETWRPFGINDAEYDDARGRSGLRVLNVTWRRPKGSPKDEGRATRPPGSVLVSVATVLLGLLAVGLFIVSLAAQYEFVLAQKHEAVPAVIEAVALDVGMTIFSLLALGLAMAGQPARTERGLIIACAAGSAAMNYAAANDRSPRSVAAFVLPPVFLAIVVDRVVAVVRRHVLGDTDRSAWTGFGRVVLYGLRFLLAAPTTAKGLRRWVLVATPLPDPSTAALSPVTSNVPALPAAVTPGNAGVPTATPGPEARVNGTPINGRGDRPAGPRGESKRAQLISAYEALQGTDARYGDRSKASQVARELAAEVGMQWGSARTALYRHLDARAEDSS